MNPEKTASKEKMHTLPIQLNSRNMEMLRWIKACRNDLPFVQIIRESIELYFFLAAEQHKGTRLVAVDPRGNCRSFVVFPLVSDVGSALLRSDSQANLPQQETTNELAGSCASSVAKSLKKRVLSHPSQKRNQRSGDRASYGKHPRRRTTAQPRM